MLNIFDDFTTLKSVCIFLFYSEHAKMLYIIRTILQH